MKGITWRTGIPSLLLVAACLAPAANAQMAWRERDGAGFPAPADNAATGRFDDGRLARESGSSIREVWGRAGDIIDALQVLNGPAAMPFHGGDGGSAWGFRLDQGDFLVEVRGFYGNWYGNIFVSQLTFITARGRVYGPFGKNNGVQDPRVIEIQATPGRQIIAFTGSTGVAGEADGNASTFLASLGAVFAPIDWGQGGGWWK